MVKNFLLKIGRLLAGVRLDGLSGRIANRRYKTAALLAAGLLVFEFAYLTLIWPKAPTWSIKGLPASFQWGGLKFQQAEMGQSQKLSKSILGIDSSYSQGLFTPTPKSLVWGFTDDGKYFIIMIWRPEGWNEDMLKDEFSDYLAKTYPSQRQLVLPDKTSVTESVFMPENVTIKVLPAFNLRLLTKNGHSMTFLVSRNALVFSNNPPALFNLLTVDK